MRFMYQAAEEAASDAQRMAQKLLNPASSATKIEPKILVAVSLCYAETDGAATTTRHLTKVEQLVEQYVRADMPNLVNRAIADLDQQAKNALVAAKTHLQTELARIEALEKKNEGI